MLAIGLFFVRVRHVGHKITGLAVQAFAQRLNGAGVNPSGLLAEQFAPRLIYRESFHSLSGYPSNGYNPWP